MAADVSRQITKSEAKSSALITRDFLGGGAGIESKELDLDLHVPSGWEKRLDLKSGKVYIQRCSPSTSSDQKSHTNQASPRLQDLNFPPQSKPTLNLFEETSLDLKLMSPSSSNNYQSVCTLDKVKSALDRAERESSKKRSTPSILSASSPSNSSSMSVKEMDDDDVKLPCKLSSLPSDENGLMVAVACPLCLLYVLILKNNPKCPKCNSTIQLPVIAKKPRIDLNISI
ncbi:hypothetical protein Nepgr_012510 [Nepenthes gracilis]|uniref:GIR1-like zinc ribbon domain-containing protein n=1 Tax=Nepenthes gracilis TaxID=150966 RepID=A0AAD3SHE4_NEPGR|nr:hypothetical protein Nepgr_012510 [Nepenthes gracilis]